MLGKDREQETKRPRKARQRERKQIPGRKEERGREGRREGISEKGKGRTRVIQRAII